MSNYDRVKAPMIKSLKERILNKGFTVLSNKPTKSVDNVDAEDSCLDLMIMNQVKKIVSYQRGIDSISDHTLQMLSQSTRGIKSTRKYLRIRSFKDFEKETFKDNVKNHGDFIETLYETEPDKITQKIQNIILESIEETSACKNNTNVREEQGEVKSRSEELDSRNRYSIDELQRVQESRGSQILQKCEEYGEQGNSLRKKGEENSKGRN